jgi:hypothetical protein
MDEPVTLSFPTFWSWLSGHPNCIIRAGTSEAVLYDDDDLHWHFGGEGAGTEMVQVLRGKRLIGEMFLRPEQVTYVQGGPGDAEGEYVFELISETERDRFAPYFFVLAHGYGEEGEAVTHARVH